MLKLAVFLLTGFSFLSASAGVREDIDLCGNNAQCVGNVIVNYYGSGTGSQNQRISFYSDTFCPAQNLIGSITFGTNADVNERLCRRLDVNARVYSTSVDGACSSRWGGQSLIEVCKTLK